MSALAEPLVVLALGLANGLALCAFVFALPPLRRPTLSSRIAPYLRDQESLIDVYAPPTPRSQGLLGLLRTAGLGAALWVTSRITTDATVTVVDAVRKAVTGAGGADPDVSRVYAALGAGADR